MTAAGAHCARTATVGGAQQRCGPGRGLPWPQWRRRGKTPETGVVADGVEGVSVEEELVEQSVELPVPQMAEQLVVVPKIDSQSSGGLGPLGPERETRQAKCPSMKPGLWGSPSTVSRQHPRSQFFRVKPGPRGQERRPMLASQRLQSTVLLQSLNSQRVLMKFGPSWSKAYGMNSAAAAADTMLADVARLRDQFQQLWDVLHTRELLVKRLRESLPGQSLSPSFEWKASLNCFDVPS